MASTRSVLVSPPSEICLWPILFFYELSRLHVHPGYHSDAILRPGNSLNCRTLLPV
jgi:hypothetical protein